MTGAGVIHFIIDVYCNIRIEKGHLAEGYHGGITHRLDGPIQVYTDAFAVQHDHLAVKVVKNACPDIAVIAQLLNSHFSVEYALHQGTDGGLLVRGITVTPDLRAAAGNNHRQHDSVQTGN